MEKNNNPTTKGLQTGVEGVECTTT